MIEVDVRLRRGAFSLECRFRSDTGALALFGRSGSGKSTLLSVIAGLVRPDAGVVRIDGDTLVDVERGVFVAPHRRRVGMVFQDALLFPHLSVRANLDYGRRFAPREAAVAPQPVIDMLGIGALLDRRPGSLSGGERQRVAIGRALLSAPRLLLLDEPLASLDLERREEIMPYVARLRDAQRWPLIYVSHAVEEVVRIAREVVVIDAGRVVATGTPGQVLGPMPGSEDLGRIDAVSVIEARVQRHDADYGLTTLEHPAGMITLPGRIGEPGQRRPVRVRATDVSLALQRPPALSIPTVLRGAIRRIDPDPDAGPLAMVEIALHGEGQVLAAVTRKAIDVLGLDLGHEVFALVKTATLDEDPLAPALSGSLVPSVRAAHGRPSPRSRH